MERIGIELACNVYGLGNIPLAGQVESILTPSCFPRLIRVDCLIRLGCDSWLAFMAARHTPPDDSSVELAG